MDLDVACNDNQIYLLLLLIQVFEEKKNHEIHTDVTLTLELQVKLIRF